MLPIAAMHESGIGTTLKFSQMQQFRQLSGVLQTKRAGERRAFWHAKPWPDPSEEPAFGQIATRQKQSHSTQRAMPGLPASGWASGVSVEFGVRDRRYRNWDRDWD